MDKDGSPLCDKGIIFSRHFGCTLPCVHPVLRHDFAQHPADVTPYFAMAPCSTDVRHAPYHGTWGEVALRDKSRLAIVDETMADPFRIAERDWQTTQFLRTLASELRAMGYERPGTPERLHFEFGRLLGKLENELPHVIGNEPDRLAKSRFLIDIWKTGKRGQH
jgi:hypothetical protein